MEYCLHLAVGQRLGGAVLGELLNLFFGITEALEHFVVVAAQRRTRTVGRGVARDSEGASNRYEFADLAPPG